MHTSTWKKNKTWTRLANLFGATVRRIDNRRGFAIESVAALCADEYEIKYEQLLCVHFEFLWN